MTDNLDLVEAACAELADQGERITFTVVAELTASAAPPSTGTHSCGSSSKSTATTSTIDAPSL